MPLLFQLGLGLSILLSGALTGLFALGGLTMRALAARILDRFGFRSTLIAGTLTSAAAFAGLGLIQSVNYAIIVPLVIITGFAQALVLSGLNRLVFADATEEEMGRATGLSAVSQQVGLTAGIAVTALILQAGGNPAPNEAPELAHFPAAFWAMSGVLLLARPRFCDCIRARRASCDTSRPHMCRTMTASKATRGQCLRRRRRRGACGFLARPCLAATGLLEDQEEAFGDRPGMAEDADRHLGIVGFSAMSLDLVLDVRPHG